MDENTLSMAEKMNQLYQEREEQYKKREKLFDDRFTTPRLVTQNLAVDGYIAYRQQVEPLATDHRCGQIETSGTSRLVFGQKEDPHTGIPWRRMNSCGS